MLKCPYSQNKSIPTYVLRDQLRKHSGDMFNFPWYGWDLYIGCVENIFEETIGYP